MALSNHISFKVSSARVYAKFTRSHIRASNTKGNDSDKSSIFIRKRRSSFNALYPSSGFPSIIEENSFRARIKNSFFSSSNFSFTRVSIDELIFLYSSIRYNSLRVKR